MKEKSCGAVIYKIENEEIKFLFILHNSGFWSFPKGHVEKGETEIETAIREVYEETNLNINIKHDFRCSIEYFIPHKNIMKEAVYFIATPNNTDIKLQTEEVSDYKWLNFKDAINIIEKENLKEVLIKVNDYLKR